MCVCVRAYVGVNVDTRIITRVHKHVHIVNVPLRKTQPWTMTRMHTTQTHRQRQSSFLENPCEDRISFSWGFHSSAHTCEPVSIELRHAPVCVFQNLIFRSAVPPPDFRYGCVYVSGYSKLSWKLDLGAPDATMTSELMSPANGVGTLC